MITAHDLNAADNTQTVLNHDKESDTIDTQCAKINN